MHAFSLCFFFSSPSMAVYAIFVALLAAVIVSAIIATMRRPLDSCHRALKARLHSNALPFQLGGSACTAIMGKQEHNESTENKKFKAKNGIKKEDTHI